MFLIKCINILISSIGPLILKSYRVKSGKIGHQVNSDIRLTRTVTLFVSYYNYWIEKINKLSKH